ncbi:MAG: hypothetical protein R3A11_01125 [Bdellovibrionota bacterium]
MKVTMSKNMETFAYWLEQLLAESSGKEKKGILPFFSTDDEKMAGEFVLRQDQNSISIPSLEFTLTFDSELGLAESFFLWEMVTSILGIFLNVNPFDEPDVTLAKTKCSRCLESSEKNMLDLIPSSHKSTWSTWTPQKNAPGAAVIVLDYLAQNDKSHSMCEVICQTIEQNFGRRCIRQMGPRYLHSTGQLFKGGVDQAEFILLTQDQPELLHSPSSIGFTRLKHAQASGDVLAMIEKGRRVTHIHLDPKTLDELFQHQS